MLLFLTDANFSFYFIKKLIAEAWDAGGLYQVGTFPHWQIWSEWNGKVGLEVKLFYRGSFQLI